MDERSKKFLDDNFKAGEYTQVVILVRNESLSKLMDVLSTANMTLAVMPMAKAKMDFNDPTKGSGSKNGH